MKRKMLLNTATSLLTQLVAVVCGFILPRMILDRFGSNVNGLTQSVAQFLGIIGFLDLGIGQVVRSALYRPLEEKDHEKISSILISGRKFYRRIAYVLLVYVIAVMVVYPYLADRQFGAVYTATLICAMAISYFAQFYFGIINEQLLQADQRGYISYALQIGTNLLNLLVCIGIIRAGGSIHAVKLAASLIYMVRPMAMQWYVCRRYSIDKRVPYDPHAITQKWNGVAQHISAVVLEGTDTIVLTIFATLSDVSIYSVYFMVISGICQFYRSLTAGIQSMVGALWAKREYRELERVFGSIEMALHFLTVFLFSCMGRLIVPFVQVYTDGLTDAEYIQPIFAGVLVLAYAVRCLRTPYNILILAGGHYKQTQTCHIVAAVLNLAISVAAVSAWGLVGIALGTLTALMYQTGWMIYYDSKNLIRWPLGRVAKQTAADILTAVLIFGATGGIRLGTVTYLGWFVMAVQVAAVAFAITAAVVFVCCREKLAAIYHGLIRKKFGKQH